MKFEQFIQLFNKPVPKSISMDSKPVEVLEFIRSKPLESLDLDFLDDYIEKVTPEHPDEWEYDEDCVGEIEDLRDAAFRAIEKMDALDSIG